MNKRLLILITLSTALLGFFLFFRFSDSATSALWSLSNGGTWLLPLVAVSALIDSINPCAFSILLLTIAFLFSIGRMRSNVLKIGGAYIFGIFVVYVLIGLGILQALHLFNTPHFMAKLGASLLVVLGLINIVNEFFPKFPLKLQIPQAAHHKMAEFMEKGSLFFAVILGGLVGLCEFPCTGGPYLMVLGLLHDVTTYAKGIGYLLFYNLIFIAPLALILFIATNQGLVDKVRSWQRTERKFMKLGSGVAMIILGILVFFL